MSTNANIGPFGIKLGVGPSGGWRYPFPTEHAERLDDPYLRASGFWQLVSAVRIFRIQAGLQVGAVEYDVAEYVKGYSPSNIVYPGRVYERPAEGSPLYRPPIVRVTEWLILQGMKKGGPKLVIKPDADERADICAKCLHNVEWRTSCKPCVEEVEYRGQNVRQRPIYERDQELGMCRRHDVLLGVAVFLDQDHLPAKQADAPENCWMPYRP